MKFRNPGQHRLDANRFPLIREIFFWSIACLCIWFCLCLRARLMSFLAIKTPVAHTQLEYHRKRNWCRARRWVMRAALKKSETWPRAQIKTSWTLHGVEGPGSPPAKHIKMYSKKIITKSASTNRRVFSVGWESVYLHLLDPFTLAIW